MYPSNLQTNLRRCEGAYGQTSLARTFTYNRQTGLSPVARSTFSSKNIELLALSALGFSAEPILVRLRAEGEKLRARFAGLRSTIRETGPVAQVARAHP